MAEQNISLQECEILGPLGYLVQMFLGILSFTVLICINSLYAYFLVKRQIERPKRLWKVFIMDSSKQISSALFAHILNVVLAQFFSNNQNGNPCIWFQLLIIKNLDTTIGVGFCYIFMKIFENLFEISGRLNLQSGNYYKVVGINSSNQSIASDNIRKQNVQIDYQIYFYQLIFWNFIVLVVLFVQSQQIQSKSILFLFQQTFSIFLENQANKLFSPFSDSPKLLLILVMVIIPLILNALCVILVLLNQLQFWIQDNFLKKNKFRSNEKELIKDLLYEKDDVFPDLQEIEISMDQLNDKQQEKTRNLSTNSNNNNINFQNEEEI